MASELKPPIILLGNVRSGTTMMHDLFDLHPEVVSWFEPRTIWTYADPRRRHDRFDETDATPRVIRYIRRRFLRYQRKHGDRRVMEKTPSNVLRIPYVQKIFPEAKLVYILREPLAFLSSVDLRWRRVLAFRRLLTRLAETPKTQLHHYLGRYVTDQFRVRVLKRRQTTYGVRYPEYYEDVQRLPAFEVIAKQWVHCAQLVDRDLAAADPGSVLRMRYEDFVAAPVEHFERIGAFTGLDLTEELRRAVARIVDPGRQQKWRRLDPAVLARCMPVLREEMLRQGYTIDDELEALVAPEATAATGAAAPAWAEQPLKRSDAP